MHNCFKIENGGLIINATGAHAQSAQPSEHRIRGLRGPDPVPIPDPSNAVAPVLSNVRSESIRTVSPRIKILTISVWTGRIASEPWAV